VVHVEGERRGGGVAGQPPCLAGVLVERVPEAAELLGERQLQVAGRCELVEVVLAELVVPIVAGRAIAAALEQRIRKTDVTLMKPPQLGGAS
jgi:hypothetical protein